MAKQHWMVCDVRMNTRDRNETPCLFEEKTALAMAAHDGMARCIRHGALLFSNTRLDGLTREQARQRLNED